MVKTIIINGEKITIKRENWTSGYHVSARDSKGHFKSTKKWKDKTSTEIVRKKLVTSYIEKPSKKEIEEEITYVKVKPEEKEPVKEIEPVKKLTFADALPRYRITVSAICRRKKAAHIYPSGVFDIKYSFTSDTKYMTEYQKEKVKLELFKINFPDSRGIEILDIIVIRIYDDKDRKRIL